MRSGAVFDDKSLATHNGANGCPTINGYTATRNNGTNGTRDNVPGGKEHNAELEARYAGRIRRTA